MVTFNSMLDIYCTIMAISSGVLNLLFIGVTHLKKVEGFQEVLVFMRNIAIAYILLSVCILLLAPVTVLFSSGLVLMPHGIGAYFDTTTMNAITAFGFGFYLYTMLAFMIMFLYRYNVTCKTSSMSAIFSTDNIAAFLSTSALLCLIQSILFYYSSVDPKLLLERLSRVKNVRSLDFQFQNDTLFNSLKEAQSSRIYPTDVVENHQLDQSLQQPVLGANKSTSLQTLNFVGYDFTRNPTIFLAFGIFAFTSIVTSITNIVTSLVVFCKLRGQQESMSKKSQTLHQKLTNVLILDAYMPVLLSLAIFINLFVCVIRHECILIQEYLSLLMLAPIPVLFPLINIFLVPPLRKTALEVLTCIYWRRKRTAENKQKSKNVAEAQEELNEDQLKALKNMDKKADNK